MRHYVDNRIVSRANQMPQRGGDEAKSLIKYHYLSQRYQTICLLHQATLNSCPNYRRLSNTNQRTGRCLPLTTRVYALHNDVHRIVGTDVLILNVCGQFQVPAAFTGKIVANR
jgi:hypothetical protein